MIDDQQESNGFTRPPSGAARVLQPPVGKPVGYENRGQVSGHLAVKLETFWEEELSPADESGMALQRYGMHEEFTGGIVGLGNASHLRVTRKDGQNTFNGIERITGTLAGRKGSFVITDAGFYDQHNIVHGRWTVVAGSGTDELVGLRAEGEFIVAIDLASGPTSIYKLDYWFEEDGQNTAS